MKPFPWQLQAEFSPEFDLPGQYILTAGEHELPPSWSRHELGRWRLASEKRLPVFRLEDQQGNHVGFILGYPITAEGQLWVDQSLSLRLPDLAQFAEWLYTLSGRWLAILLTGDRERVYMDAVGSLVCVYSPSLGIVAASPALVPYTAETQDRVELIEQMPIPESVAMYFVGMTPRYGVSRLLPNHYLDLAEWQQHRHWPCGPIQRVADTDAACAEVGAFVKRNIAAVAAEYPLQLSITGGRDSRLLMACARSLIEDIQFFTSDLPEEGRRSDVVNGSKIARRFGLNHQIIPFTPPSERQTRLWLYRSGCAMGSYHSMISMNSIQRLDPRRAYLSGYVGEVARYFYQRQAAALETSRSGVTPEFLLGLINAPATDEARENVTSWLANQPLQDLDQVLDLYYVEQRIGAWIAVGSSAVADFVALELWPLNNRRVVEIMLGLPLDFKLKAGLHDKVIAAEWPELLELPFNQPVDSSSLPRKIRRAARRLGF